MSGSVVILPPGCRGFDINQPLDAEGARAWAAKGFRFVKRYVPRRALASTDLTGPEVQRIHDAGMAVSAVQHVEPEGWLPNPEKGAAYGRVAVVSCLEVGLPSGVGVALDLEGIARGVSVDVVVAYCQEWFGVVTSAGYKAELYIGWQCVLNRVELYRRLSFDRYWLAYNGNADQIPIVRGVCMRQRELPNAQRPAGYAGLDGIDEDIVQSDQLGGLPAAYAPEGWAA